MKDNEIFKTRPGDDELSQGLYRPRGRRNSFSGVKQTTLEDAREPPLEKESKKG